MGYYMGIDGGTNSSGWAVTDKQYNLLRAKGNDLWGVREFDKADSAAGRRVYRSSERMNERDIVRRGFVRSYFSDEIEKVDPLFFVRLDNSRYYYGKDTCDKDCRLNSRFGLFNDDDYTDVDYFKKYNTIYHLRRELLKNENAPYDVRLVFLAINSLFKRRGHFLLNADVSGNDTTEIKECYEELLYTLDEEYGISILSESFDAMIEILSDKSCGKKKKYERLQQQFNISKKDKPAQEFLKCLSGMTADLKIMFDIDAEEKISVSLGSYSIGDEAEGELLEKLADEQKSEVISHIKLIYDYSQLQAVMKGDSYLSEARVDMFDKHHADLETLKSLYRKYKTKEEYSIMFRSDKPGTYGAYVNSTNSKDSKAKAEKQRRSMGGNTSRSAESLYKKIKSDFKDVQDEGVKHVFYEIDNETFLPKQLTASNGIIPNQVHLKELVKILDNAEKYLPFLRNKDDSGLTVSERIIRLFSFQMPYYIGPTNTDSKTGWAVRKEQGRILPWNIDTKLDIPATSEKFISRMVRECSFLCGEKVLPKSSLLYEEYCVLNEINALCIDGERLDTEAKQKLYRDKFQHGSKLVTKKSISLYFGVPEEKITGIDKKVNSTLSSYKKMYSILGERLNEDKVRAAAEELIYWRTVFSDAKSMFEDKMSAYISSGVISQEEGRRISAIKFKDWGRLSKEMLELQGVDKSTGEKIALITAMREYSLNLQELLNSDDFTFKESLKEKTVKAQKTLSEFTYEDLDEYYYSAPVKRMIWQTMLVIREIEGTLGEAPERVFIEMARADEEKGDKGRKNSRAKQLLDAYKELEGNRIPDWEKSIKKAEDDGLLNSKKLYLYYMQNGCDMYTGETINIENLFDDNLYDIDHIYPRHYKKDDSLLNNLVLVNKAANEKLKKDMYPVPESIRKNVKVKELWTRLHRSGLLTDEKYRRLTDNKPFSDEQLADFINRQLVETRQGTKGIAELITALMPDTKVIYSKAGNVSDFRHEFKLAKCRIANEFHHAQDAYLNIVVGNAYYTKFTNNAKYFIVNEYGKDMAANHYNLGTMYKWDIARNGETAWKADTSKCEGTIRTVRKVLGKNSPLITILPYIGKGELFNATVYGKYDAKPENYVPVKKNDKALTDVNKYGGYTSLKPAYFIFVECQNGKKRKKVFDVVPIYYQNEIKSESDLVNYCEKKLGMDKVRIICSKIKINTLFKMNGYLVRIAGMDSRKNVEFHNAESMHLPLWAVSYAHAIEKTLENQRIHPDVSREENIKLYEFLTKKHLKAPFTNSPKSIGNMLTEGETTFCGLEEMKQVNVLYKLLTVSSLSGKSADLKEIGGSSETGRLRISGNMTNCSELLRIDSSPAGLYSIVTDLLKA